MQVTTRFFRRSLNAILLFGAIVLGLAVQDAAAKPLIYVSTGWHELGTIDLTTKEMKVIGHTTAGSQNLAFTDIAFAPNGKLYGVTFSHLYVVDPTTGKSTLVGALGVNGANALEIGADGIAYMARYNSRQLYEIDLFTGAASDLGRTGYKSSGDLAFYDGELYLTSTTEKLVKIDLGTVTGSKVGYHGKDDLFGLVGTEDGLYGLGYGSNSNLFKFNHYTGKATWQFGTGPAFMNDVFGATYWAGTEVPEPVTGLMMGFGLAATAMVRRRRKRAA